MEIKKVLEKVLGFMKYFPEVTPEDFKKERKNGVYEKWAAILHILLVIAFFCFFSVDLASADSYTYILSGGPSSETLLVVDDDLEVKVNGKTVFIDNDGVSTHDGRATWKGSPITFSASPGDALRIIATNPGGVEIELSPLYLHLNEQSLKLSEGVPKEINNTYEFFNKSFTISILTPLVSILDYSPSPVHGEEDLDVKVSWSNIPVGWKLVVSLEESEWNITRLADDVSKMVSGSEEETFKLKVYPTTETHSEAKVCACFYNEKGEWVGVFDKKNITIRPLPTKTGIPTEYLIVGGIALVVILLLGFALRPKPSAPEKAVLVTRETEFYNGFIRLKISVANQSKLTVNNVALDLDFEKYILRYDRHEPEFPIIDNKIQLGNLDPNTSKAVAIYLDPMICTKTGNNLNCRVDYKDSYGNPKSVQMKTKKVKVVCPIFLTESDINIGILKELLDKLPFHDSKVYKIQTDFEIDKLMEICKEVIQRHDVRHIRTFATKDKNTIETWYYGKTKVEKNDLIIKASVNTDTKSIEIFSATQNQESLTGILAELGHKLSEKITSETKNQESIQKITNLVIKDSIIQRSNLLSFCDLDGKCTGDVVVQDRVIQRSQIGVEKNKCPNCGNKVHTGDKFCRECGFKLKAMGHNSSDT